MIFLFYQVLESSLVLMKGNPYGLVVSGLDATIEQLFGPEVHQEISAFIKEAYAGTRRLRSTRELITTGKQPTSCSFIVPISENLNIAYTPAFPRGEYTTYDGLKATFQAVEAWNSQWKITTENKHGNGRERPIHSICCPGFGTYTGMCPEDLIQVTMVSIVDLLLMCKEMEQAYLDWKSQR